MKCPKCGETRSGEAAPQSHCQACGVFFAKIEPGADEDAARIVTYPDPPPRTWGFGMTIALLLLAASAYGFAPLPDLPGRDRFKNADFSRSRIVMYSLTNCAECRELRQKLVAHKVPFEEHFIDQDPARMNELFARLRGTGHWGGVSTPTLEVNRQMMINNPSFDRIVKAALR